MVEKRSIKEMLLKDKISYCTGKDFWNTKAMPEYGIESIKMADGPHGLRCQCESADMLGINDSLPATCFPTAVTAGSTWNRELYAAEGRAIALEGSEAGVSVILGPGCNIKRNPLCGRNFEYISEDPYLSGYMAAAFIKGVQSVDGMSACLKHFAANSQEHKRQVSDSIIDERTLREIYLTPFEIATKVGKPNSVMCSYNKINGIYASDNKWLLTDVLRREWGFDGTVITDWGALNNRIKAFEAGCDLNMPGGSKYMHKSTLRAVENGLLDENVIDQSISRIAKLAEHGTHIKKEKFDRDAHHSLAVEIARQGAVLLKNDSSILPLDESDTVIIGKMAATPRYQGSGSSHINPTRLTSVQDAMPSALCYPCGDERGNITEQELAEAVELAKSEKIAVVAVGLPDCCESEAFDRKHMRLPTDHNRLVELVAEVNENTVVLLFGGGAMELPWAEKVKAILYMGLAGQGVGEAAADLLSGRACPSGKLTESWPYRYSDVISSDFFGTKDAEYRESVFVGYRYYSSANVPVRYPFGFGLSYTNFEYSDLKVSDTYVTVTVKNIGNCHGAEVIQLYVTPPSSGTFRPAKELKGFERIELEAGQSATVTFTLDNRSFSVWQDDWVVEGGIYGIEIGSSSEDIRLRCNLEISGDTIKEPMSPSSLYYSLSSIPSKTDFETILGRSVLEAHKIKKGSFDRNSTIFEMKESSLIMKLIYGIINLFFSLRYGKKKDTDPTCRMMLISVTDNPIRSLEICSGGALPEFLSNFIIWLANLI